MAKIRDDRFRSDRRTIYRGRRLLPAAALALVALWLAPAGAAAIAPGPWALPPVNLSAAGGSAEDSQLAFTPDGTTVAVWSRDNGIENTIQAATRPPGGSFGAAVDLSAPGKSAYNPAIAVAPDGTATVVWYRSDGSNLRVQAATRPPGGGFGAAVDLSAPGQSAYNPAIAVAPDGTATVVWYRRDGSNYIIQAATRPAGGSFGAAVDLSAPGQDAYSPAVAADGDGATTAVWTRSDGSNYIIQAATRPAGGSFGAAMDLSQSGQSADVPRIAFAADHTAIVVWHRFDGSNNIIQAATRPPGGSFGAAVDLSAPGQDADVPRIAFAPDDTATAVWRRFDGSNYIIQAATRPAGGSFGAAVDLSAPGQHADEPRIGFAPDGTAAAVWHRQNGSKYVVQTATRPPGGSFGAAVDLSADGQNAGQAQIAFAPDGTGTGTVIWRRFDGSDFVAQTVSTAPQRLLLGVSREGNGQGQVTADVGRIECGVTCAATLPAYTEVTLTATAENGSTFTGWAGDCSRAEGATCQVRMDRIMQVIAAFSRPTCQAATLNLGRLTLNRRKGTGRLNVTLGAPGRVMIRGADRVKAVNRQVNRARAVRLNIRARGSAGRQLRRRGSTRIRLNVTFRPRTDCRDRTRTRNVRLIRRR